MDTTYPELAELLLVVIKNLMSKLHNFEVDRGQCRGCLLVCVVWVLFAVLVVLFIVLSFLVVIV